MRKSTVKFGTVCLVLCLINISVFVAMIFQMDLIAENSQYQVNNTAAEVHIPITPIVERTFLNSMQYAYLRLFSFLHAAPPKCYHLFFAGNRMIFFYCQAAVVLATFIYLLMCSTVSPSMSFKKAADTIFFARTKMKGNDKFAFAGKTFNKMIGSEKSFAAELKKENNLMNMELNSVELAQKEMYPKKRELPYCRIAVYDNPLEKVSGDFYDFMELPNGSYGFFIADVVGHGVSAAMVTMKIKGLLGDAAARFAEPEDVMRFLNTTFDNMMEQYSSYFTAYYLIYNPKTRILKYSSAGHPTPIIVHKDSKVETFDLSGFIIGISGQMSMNLNAEQIQLLPGDCIVLYSDGITEARSSAGTFLEESGLIKFLQVSNREIETNPELTGINGRKVDLLLERSVAQFKHFTKGSVRKDDETLIIIEVE